MIYLCATRAHRRELVEMNFENKTSQMYASVLQLYVRQQCAQYVLYTLNITMLRIKCVLWKARRKVLKTFRFQNNIAAPLCALCPYVAFAKFCLTIFPSIIVLIASEAIGCVIRASNFSRRTMNMSVFIFNQTNILYIRLIIQMSNNNKNGTLWHLTNLQPTTRQMD